MGPPSGMNDRDRMRATSNRNAPSERGQGSGPIGATTAGGARSRGYAVRDIQPPNNKRRRDDYDDYQGDYPDDDYRRRYHHHEYYQDSDRRDHPRRHSFNSDDRGPARRRSNEDYYGPPRGGGGGGGGGGGSSRAEGRDYDRPSTTSRREDEQYAGRSTPREEMRDWKCRECSCWNYPDERRCHRCGLSGPPRWEPPSPSNANATANANKNNAQKEHKHERRSNSSRSRSRSSSSGDDDDDDDSGSGMDEFGRRKSDGVQNKKRNKNEWPPCFQDDDEGERFVLDPRSGMFYDQLSDFFYDPTSKLYYGNKKHAYFSYNATTNKFTPVDSTVQSSSLSSSDPKGADENNDNKTKHLAPPAGSNAAAQAAMDQDHLLLVPNVSANKPSTEPPKAVIAINLKTAIGANKKTDRKKKKRSDSNVADPITTTTTTSAQNKDEASNSATGAKPDEAGVKPANKLQKQHVAYMETWSKRGKELQQGAGDASNPPASSASAAPETAGAVARGATAKGKPICWICKRKFPTLEKLQQHEEKSALHKENLAKHQEQENQQEQPQNNEGGNSKPNATTAVEDSSNNRYLDRAQQRRDLYGPELVLPPTASSVVDALAAPSVGAPSLMGASVGEPVGNDTAGRGGAVLAGNNNNNIGHEMLQKLGWKSGTSLGRGTEHQREQQAALAQDWDRIENLAAQNQASASRRYQSN